MEEIRLSTLYILLTLKNDKGIHCRTHTFRVEHRDSKYRTQIHVLHTAFQPLFNKFRILPANKTFLPSIMLIQFETVFTIYFYV